jgi:hypothetical protein
VLVVRWVFLGGYGMEGGVASVGERCSVLVACGFYGAADDGEPPFPPLVIGFGDGDGEDGANGVELVTQALKLVSHAAPL